MIKEMTVDTLASKMQNNDSFTLIDVREDSEWESGHIPKARHIRLGIIAQEITKRVPDKTELIVLYCGSGIRSGRAAEALQDLGYSNVYSLQDGIKLWQRAHHPIVKE